MIYFMQVSTMPRWRYLRQRAVSKAYHAWLKAARNLPLYMSMMLLRPVHV
jgi:hypothetical protein